MSLDVHLEIGPEQIETCSHCEGTGKINLGPERVFDWNITHNLSAMARAAGIYLPVWRPEEMGIAHAKQMIGPLREGIADLVAHPERYRKYNPYNGWGDYEVLLTFLRRYLSACEEHPDALVRASR